MPSTPHPFTFWPAWSGPTRAAFWLTRSPGGIALFYLLAAALWIYGSDRLVVFLAAQGFDASVLQTLKGWAFVAGTAALLYLVLRRRHKVIKRTEAELLRAQARAHRARVRAEKLSRLKSSLLANLSHEIRTPLTAIMGFADLLRAEPKGRTCNDTAGDGGTCECSCNSDSCNRDVWESAEYIYRSSERLLDTFNAVLDLAQFESECRTLHPERLDLRELVREAIAPLRREARSRGLRFHVSLPSAPATACLDPGATTRIVKALVSNAVKFTGEGGVSVMLRRAGDEAALQVADTGEGMREAFLPRAFDAFEQESSGMGRRHEGLGLGLTIARHLAKAMGGRIDVESEKGRGSIFEVRLPVAQTSTAGQPEEAALHTSNGELASDAGRASRNENGRAWAPYRRSASVVE